MRWPWRRARTAAPVVARPQSVRVTIEHSGHSWTQTAYGSGLGYYASAGYGRGPIPCVERFDFDLDVRLTERELLGVEVLQRARPGVLQDLFEDDRQLLGVIEDDAEEMRRARGVWAALDAYAMAQCPAAGTVHDAMLSALSAMDAFYRAHPERAACVRG